MAEIQGWAIRPSLAGGENVAFIACHIVFTKNALRRASGLPLYDVEKELARFHADQQAAAYAAFVWNDCLSLNSCAARSGRLPWPWVSLTSLAIPWRGEIC